MVKPFAVFGVKNPIFDIAFWQERLAASKKGGRLVDSIGLGFNFELIDSIHRRIVAKEIRGYEKVLDVGCGYGRVASWFSESQYAGVDFVPEFIQLAKESYPLRLFILADIRHLPLPDRSFDWGILISMKVMIQREIPEEWPVVEKELLRVCKKLLILEYGASRDEEIRKYEIISHKGVQSLSL